MSNLFGWTKVVFAGDLLPDEDGELSICPVCMEDYAECGCPGPTMDEYYDYMFDENGVMWANKKDDIEPEGVDD